ncbi:flagellar basal body-associated FliL family protein [Azospirillum oryzae]|uniref:Flagellar protein FliL n=1 Tax=Azospirillum oryzae TaxID=286727 RepID=A0A6N1ARP0_9PROT|nr:MULTISPECIES: flagellar basal body-associated FliL family protein [Azospirillum]KAA0582667.1 flagellar basal body protein FliL [Azospirillum sp. Sh1]KAA0589982.1 flagellar basal body protein FliL [Azospirillum oryzae]QKS51824.1 flagellar basal body-associated FliL family protein [Azospirillum oryzae]GLR82747.1 flagellar basal body protein FliL [Azospirillum oryzae]
MAAETDAGELTDGLPRKKFSGKKLVLFVVLPLVLLIGAGAGVYFSGLLDSFLGKEKPAEEGEHAAAEGEHGAEPGKADPHAAPIFYDLPDMLVNLNTGNKRPAFLKIKISIQLSKPEDVGAVEHVLPRIIDNFQVYLRELRLEDLRGSAGMYRLRQELLLRITAAAFPVKVKDVLFKEMLVQ